MRILSDEQRHALIKYNTELNQLLRRYEYESYFTMSTDMSRGGLIEIVGTSFNRSFFLAVEQWLRSIETRETSVPMSFTYQITYVPHQVVINIYVV